MKKGLLLFVLLMLPLGILFSQKSLSDEFRTKGEIYFRFDIDGKSVLPELTRVISIDNVVSNTVFAYANEREFNSFLSLGYKYQILPHPGDVPDVKMSSNLKSIAAWDVYPTYDAYVTMMNQFQTNYPNLCKIIDIGTTVNGRKLLVARVTGNVNAIAPAKPEFMYSSSIHGDEITGAMMMLRLIDSLLSTYATNPRIANLLDKVQIYINPLANPDGTYKGGNATVNGAVRYNGNNIDMNRNFQDPAAGLHPDGNAWQPETIAMMNFFKAHRFVLSGNFHGGAQVLNYPWDTWSRLHPDDIWWQLVSRAYADTVHKYSPATYLNDFNNGITNGYAWYTITGGRQDYMTYFMHGREITFEISATKLPAATEMPTFWGYNRKSLLNYIENVLYGIRGTVTNTNGAPLKAKITVQSHDADSSEVYSDSLSGFYVRMIAAGTYTLVVSSPGYPTKTITGVTVANRTETLLNIALQSPTPPITWQCPVTIKDNGNVSQLLQFGAAALATDGIDTAFGEAVLASVPATGTFDARFNLPVVPSVASRIDLRKDTMTSAIWNIQFQPGTSGYPVTVSWSNSGLGAGTYMLKDNVTGTIVNVDMKTQTSVIISNTSITGLRVEYSKVACQTIALSSGWNLVAIPVTATDMTPSTVFPQATSSVYGYDGGYVTATMLQPGKAYWVRYAGTASAQACGPIASGNIALQTGWNMIGVYGSPINISALATVPAGIINSAFFNFASGYLTATTLQPGIGYWVRVTQAGTLIVPAKK